MLLTKSFYVSNTHNNEINQTAVSNDNISTEKLHVYLRKRNS